MNILSYARGLGKLKKQKDHEAAIKKIKAVETMITQKYMMVDAENYQVVMLDNLWSMYQGKLLVNFCENLKYYCDIMNAYKGLKANKEAKLLISLKYEDDSVKPFAYFDGKNVLKYG